MAVFVQPTATPILTAPPTPTPFFFSPDPGSSGLFSAPPTFGFPTPTPPVSGPTPTPPPGFPTPTPTPPAPNAGFAMTVSGLTVQFANNSKGSGLSYLWDFGDGSGKTSPHPSHTYSAPGQYTVTLTVTDSLGRTDTRTKQVTVDNPTPPPTKEPTPTPTEPPTPIPPGA
ncbi:MAG TPA: PKD domain-containing protein [Candidatus Limnocylindrales bacterium]